MNSRVFVIDLLVNASGATLLLFFVFIVRLSPGQAEAEPRSNARPILVVDVQVLESARLDELSAILRRGGGGFAEESLHVLPPEDIANPESPFLVASSVPRPSLLGSWGATRLREDTLRLVAPCPRPDEAWRLRLVHPAAGVFPRPSTPLATTVTIRLVAPGDTSQEGLRDTVAGASLAGEPPTGHVELSPDKDLSITWKTKLDESCD